MKTIIWLLKTLLDAAATYLKWAIILMTWPISVPVLLIQRSNRRHREVMAAIERR